MSFVENRTILVTGANRGIGKSIVETFIEQGASKVYAAARNVTSLAPLVEAFGDKVVPIHLDLNAPESIVKAANTASDVEIVVNNAGILKMAEPLADDAIATLQEEIEVNVYGLMRVAKAFAPVLKQSGGGALVQLNSVASMKSFAAFSTYCASKAASYSITQGLREVLAAQGTQLVSVHPGPIATDMTKAAGMHEMAEPAELVPQAIITALESASFHAYPDTMAKQIGEAYAGFASNIVEANLMEG